MQCAFSVQTFKAGKLLNGHTPPKNKLTVWVHKNTRQFLCSYFWHQRANFLSHSFFRRVGAAPVCIFAWLAKTLLKLFHGCFYYKHCSKLGSLEAVC